MAILNYTTQIAVEKTAGEIQKKLAQAGAKAVMTEFDDEGVLSFMSFQLDTVHGRLSFRLPANIDGVFNSLTNSRVERRYRSREQAARVSWRIVKDWIEAQIALVEAEQAAMAEVFLPYMQDPATGQTVYEKLEDGGFKRLSHG